MAKNIGIIYSSTDGHTIKICKKLETFFIEQEIKTELFSIDDFDKKLSDFHTLVIGASIRYGKHHDKIYDFIKNNRSELNKINTAFFSVNLVARKSDKNTPTTNPYLIKFIKEIDWKPTFLDVFAGKLDYKSYGFFDRIMIKLIMKLTNGPVKSDEPIEFTDWNSVENFGQLLSENYKKTY